MASNAHNSLIITLPTNRTSNRWGARACGSRRGAFVRRNLFLFLIHLPLSAATLRRGGMVYSELTLDVK